MVSLVQNGEYAMNVLVCVCVGGGIHGKQTIQTGGSKFISSVLQRTLVR